MNNTAKNLIRVAGVVVGLGAAVWALRDRLLPAPEIHDEPPPRFREAGSDATASPTSSTSSPDDLTAITGVGPVNADKLAAAGITTVAGVAASDPGKLSESIGISETVATKWIDSAKNLT